jgi:hypothetical protein
VLAGCDWLDSLSNSDYKRVDEVCGMLAGGRRALGMRTAELAGCADMTVDQIQCMEEGGTEPTIAPLACG